MCLQTRGSRHISSRKYGSKKMLIVFHRLPRFRFPNRSISFNLIFTLCPVIYSHTYSPVKWKNTFSNFPWNNEGDKWLPNDAWVRPHLKARGLWMPLRSAVVSRILWHGFQCRPLNAVALRFKVNFRTFNEAAKNMICRPNLRPETYCKETWEVAHNTISVKSAIRTIHNHVVVEAHWAHDPEGDQLNIRN